MANVDMELDRPAQKLTLAASVQANLGRVSKFADKKTRNWTLYVFFRILPQDSFEIRSRLFADFLRALPLPDRAQVASAWSKFLKPVEAPASIGPGPFAPHAVTAQGVSPAPQFLAWLKVITAGHVHLGAALASLLRDPEIPDSEDGTAAVDEFLNRRVEALRQHFVDPQSGRLADWLTNGFDAPELLDPILVELLWLFSLLASVGNPDRFEENFIRFGQGDAGQAGLAALEGGLLGVCLYEIARQSRPAVLRQTNPEIPGILRNEADAQNLSGGGPGRRASDPCPINLAFTYSGLQALGIDSTMLASFPTAFKQGMAARADALRDTGPSAPEQWETGLGLTTVHGYFTAGFLVGDEKTRVPESLWRRLRSDVAAFNGQAGPRGDCLRLLLRAVFLFAGLEPVHFEIGQDPYEVDATGHVHRLPYRVEHFGFRDGVSQPFVDLDGSLGAPPPGGGTPLPDGTWAPVAPGEIFLDQPDEDGQVSQEPFDPQTGAPSMSVGSTFLVFRKLEQNVREFRAFLADQRPADRHAQTKLAARFVGRWPNGTSLVASPDAPLGLGANPDDVINNFRYAADDPKGDRCPLGAHVRRTNPRDIGGVNDVRRHRILRRSIGYGGPLLPEGSIGDGKKRGLLFVVVNSRIELQFELIQSRWINTGEFLGQAGLDRCPIIGANRGGIADAFLEPRAAAPVVRLPRFVVTRGGDYFFAPGLPVIVEIANGNTFPVTRAQLPYGGYSMGDATTPDLFFDVDRIKLYIGVILAGVVPVVKVAMPGPNPATDPEASPVVFAAHSADVQRVLGVTLNAKGKIIYSVEQYRDAGRRVSRGRDLLVGTEPGSSTAKERARMYGVFREAWKRLNANGHAYKLLAKITLGSIEAALARTRPVGAIDLVGDLATPIAYGILSELCGTPGPDWLSDLAIGLPFVRQHAGQLPLEWLEAAAKRGAAPDPGVATMQVWSILLIADIIVNYSQSHDLMALSAQAGSEFLTYLDTLVANARAKPTQHPKTLIEAFVAIENDPVVKKHYPSVQGYYYDVCMLLLEFAASTMVNIPTIFGTVMDALLDRGTDLNALIPVLLAPPQFPPPPPPPNAPPANYPKHQEGVDRLILEICRFYPPFPILMRRCKRSDSLPSGGAVSAGDWVAALVAGANLDPNAFPAWQTFSLAPYLPGPARNLDNYLLFGAANGGRACWGRDHVALYVLEECVKAAGRLKGLQRVAGSAGTLQTVLNVNVGLKARFGDVLPDWPRL